MRSPSPALSSTAAFVALVLLSINLRPAIATVPPMTPDIQADLGWSSAAIGLVTTIPVLAMGVLAPIVPRLAARWGRIQVAVAALALIAVGVLIRSLVPLASGLLTVSAMIAGAGIAIGAGLAPAFVRAWFPNNVSTLTGIYSSSMILGAAVSGAVTVPLAHALGSWSTALAAWSIPAFVALGVWVGVSRRDRRANEWPPQRPASARRSLPWRNGTAWAVALFLGLNSFVFYSLLAWVAPSYADRGWGQQDAGFVMGLFVITQVIGALTLPRISMRLRERRWLYAAAILASIIGIVVMGIAPHFQTAATATLAGLGLGGAFALGLVLLSEYGATPEASTRLTALAFVVSYALGAVGPVLMGVIVGAHGSWPLVYGILAAVCVAQLVTVRWLRRGIIVD